MILKTAVSGLSRASLIEAIYQASHVVSEASRGFDSQTAPNSHLSSKELKRVDGAVTDIIKEIERSTKANVYDLPAKRRAAVLAELYSFLSPHLTADFDRARGRDFLKELHSAD